MFINNAFESVYFMSVHMCKNNTDNENKSTLELVAKNRLTKD